MIKKNNLLMAAAIISAAIVLILTIGYMSGLFGQTQKFTAVNFNGISDQSNCTPDIICLNWSSCMPNSSMIRNCYDLNLCGKYNFTQEKSCDYLLSIHCNDNIKDFNETDVDCGGSCKKCDIGKSCDVNGDCKSNLCNPNTKKCVQSYSIMQKINMFSKNSPYLFSILILIIPTLLLLVPFFIALSYSSKKEKEKNENKDYIIYRGYVKLFYKYLKLNEFSRAKDAYFKALDSISSFKGDMPKPVFDEVKEMRNDFKKMFKSNQKKIDDKDNIPDDEFDFDMDDL